MKLINHPPFFKCKILKPCKKVLNLFRFRLRRPVFIRALPSRLWKKNKAMNNTAKKTGLSKIVDVFKSLRPKKTERDVDRVMELKSFSDSGIQKAPYPSPITPAYIRLIGENKEISDQDEVEDACRSFEKYLIEMIVEEGKMRDLTDVEELLHCWKNLKSPVFIDLVCRFYGELCKDLFSSGGENDAETANGTL